MHIKVQSKNTSRTLISLLIIGFFVGMLRDSITSYLRILPEIKLLPASLIFFLFISIIVLIFLFLLVWKPYLLLRIKNITNKVKWFIFLFIPCTLVYLLYAKWGLVFKGQLLYLWVYGSSILFMAWLITPEGKQSLSWDKIYLSTITFVCIFVLIPYFLSVIDYPFHLFWSEGNRFWDYSTLFGKNRYLYPLDKQIFAQIEPSRLFLWGLPFLLPNVTIQGMRLWNAILMSIPSILFGLISFGYSNKKQWLIIPCALWTLTFLNQGPIYTPLVLGAILTVIALHLPLIPEMLLISVTSYFLSLNRNHWMFASAMWAILCIFLGGWMPEKAKLANRWFRSILIGIAGVMGGLIVPSLFQYLALQTSTSATINNITRIVDINTRLSQHTFLWDRLFPGPTNPLGILLGLLFTTATVVLLIIIFLFKKPHKFDLWQITVLFLINVTFLIVGLVISVKIGGGNNLHNLDMYLISLVFSAAIVWNKGMGQWFTHPENKSIWICILMLMIAYIPLYWSGGINPNEFPNRDYTDTLIKQVQIAANITQPNGEVLFIDHRQLITFENIKNVRLVPEYEKKVLMNYAMEGEPTRLHGFYHDLRNHRFSLIITQPLNIQYQGNENAFLEENNSWVNNVAKPILCFYEPMFTEREIGVQLLIPREDVAIGFNGRAFCPHE